MKDVFIDALFNIKYLKCPYYAHLQVHNVIFGVS